MPSRNKQTERATTSIDWLQPHRARFLKGLSEQGYAECTLKAYDRAAILFCSAVERRSSVKRTLPGSKSSAFVPPFSAVPYRAFGPKPNFISTVSSMLYRKLALSAYPTHQRKFRALLIIFEASNEIYLQVQRGLSEATIYHSIRFLERFMTFRFGAKLGNLNDITPSDVVEFLHRVMNRDKGSRDKTPPSHLRNLFRFLFWSGKTKRDLACSLPRVARPRDTHLPRVTAHPLSRRGATAA